MKAYTRRERYAWAAERLLMAWAANRDQRVLDRYLWLCDWLTVE